VDKTRERVRIIHKNRNDERVGRFPEGAKPERPGAPGAGRVRSTFQGRPIIRFHTQLATEGGG
jgi:hypothetical protein